MCETYSLLRILVIFWRFLSTSIANKLGYFRYGNTGLQTGAPTLYPARDPRFKFDVYVSDTKKSGSAFSMSILIIYQTEHAAIQQRILCPIKAFPRLIAFFNWLLDRIPYVINSIAYRMVPFPLVPLLKCDVCKNLIRSCQTKPNIRGCLTTVNCLERYFDLLPAGLTQARNM